MKYSLVRTAKESLTLVASERLVDPDIINVLGEYELLTEVSG